MDAHDGVAPLLARAIAAEARSRNLLRATIDDVLMPESARLDERTRIAIEAALAGAVGAVEAELRQYAERELVMRAQPVLAAALANGRTPVFERLREARLLHDETFLHEVIAGVQLDLLAEALPVASPSGEEPSLLARLVVDGNQLVATAAVKVLVAGSRRKPGGAVATRSELPIGLYHNLVWWVAAALREACGGASVAADHALSAAALKLLNLHDEAERAETAAVQLAAAIDASSGEIASLLTDALGDRRAALFVAVLAHALAIDFVTMRDIVLEPAGDRLWLLLRALELPRETIARIGLALSDADPRRDLERFADTLDIISGIDPVQAREASTPLTLNRHLRAALRMLERRPAR